MMDKFVKWKLFSSKKFLTGISFLVGLILGYTLGFFKVHTLFAYTLPKISIDFSWLSWFGEMTPNPTFLSDVAAFEAAIIAQSFRKKSFIIFGATRPEYVHLSEYAVPIYDRNRHKLCQHNSRKEEIDCCEEFCMERIKVDAVLNQIRQNV